MAPTDEAKRVNGVVRFCVQFCKKRASRERVKSIAYARHATRGNDIWAHNAVAIIILAV